MPTMPNTLSAFVKMEAPQGYSRKDIIVVAGQNLAAGTVVGRITATGKFTAYDNDAVDGSQTAAGILIAAVNATAGDAQGVAVVRFAIAAKEQLIWGAGVTTQGEKDAAIVELEAAGIVCRTTV